MKLSIITCTYNSEKYLQECLNSVIAQQLNTSEYEHIFIDGDSQDQTLSMLENYQKENKENNIHILQKEAKGVYNAMNEGIKIAKGEYLLFLNSDDFLEENVLPKYLNFVKEYSEHKIFYGDLRFHHPNNKTIETNLGKLLLLRNFLATKLYLNCLLTHPSSLIKKELFHQLGHYDETKKVASDLGFRFIAIKNKVPIKYYPNIVSNFRVHEDSLSSGKEKKIGIQETYQLREEILGSKGKFINKLSNIIGKITKTYF